MKRTWSFIFLFVTGCGYKTTSLPEGITTRNLPGSGAVDFATVSAQIFQPNCVRCHGSAGGVNLSSYQGVKAALTRVTAAVNSGAMPPGGPLSPSLKSLLAQWVSAGAPEGSTGTATTTGGAGGGTAGGTAGGSTGALTFQTVNAEIFSPSCVGCHGSFSTYAGVKTKIQLIKSAVNAGRMPPSGPLSQTKKNLLNSWIDAGFPESQATGGAGAGGTSGGGDDECEDDDRLLAAGLVLPVGEGRVYDLEKEIIRMKRHGCDDR